MERRLCFQRSQRLLTASDYGSVFKRPERSHDRLFTVLYRRSDSEDARLGLAISKKHCRKATARNRIKRIVRETFRHNQNKMKGLDIVVINKPPAAIADRKALATSLTRHWRRLEDTLNG